MGSPPHIPVASLASNERMSCVLLAIELAAQIHRVDPSFSQCRLAQKQEGLPKSWEPSGEGSAEKEGCASPEQAL